MTLIGDIKAANLCIGCGYCVSLSDGQMQLDGAGFLVPHDDTKQGAQTNNLVKCACPGLNGDSVSVEKDDLLGAQNDHIWGTYFFVGTGHSTNEDIRHLGSSGGVLTAICNWLLENGHIDGALVTTYDDAYPLGTESATTSNPRQVRNSGGSKYCPASPLASLNTIRNGDGRYAIVGRPCDISTLRRAIAAGDPIGKNIKYLFSFFCAGTPSDTGNRALLSRLGISDAENLRQLRHRGNGWPGETVAELRDGTRRTCSYNESWGKVLRTHIHSMCKICPDGIGEQADIVAADAWYGDETGYPQFDEAEGRSLVIARTEVGHDLLREVIDYEVLAIDSLDVREIDKMQPGQIARRRQLATRITAYRLMGLQVPRYRRAALMQYARDQSLGSRLKTLATTVRKLLKVKFGKKR